MYTIWDSNRVVRELKSSSDPSILVSSSRELDDRGSTFPFHILAILHSQAFFVLLSYIFLLLLPSAPYPPGKPGSELAF